MQIFGRKKIDGYRYVMEQQVSTQMMDQMAGFFADKLFALLWHIGNKTLHASIIIAAEIDILTSNAICPMNTTFSLHCASAAFSP